MRIRYYQDETKDDFFHTKTSIQTTVNGDYNYLPKNALFCVFSFLIYYFVALPLLFVANVFVYGTRVHGRKNLRALRKKGFFVYANHTHYADAWLTPVFVAPFRRAYIVANKDAIQIPVVRVLTKALGALPVADTVNGLKNMNNAITTLIEKNKVVTIFPEAHIWQYHTGLRPFPITSFKFASSTSAPAVPVAVCYKKRKLFGDRRKPVAHVFVGEPIYPQPHLNERQNAEFLRDSVHDYIKNTLLEESNYAYYTYVKIDNQNQQLLQNEQHKKTI